MANENRLGRGLDALFAGGQQTAPIQPTPSTQEVRELKLEQIVPNAEQARKHFDAEKLDELAASIKEQGILQPLLVAANDDGTYTLVAGERRWRAAKIAGLDAAPVTVVAKDSGDKQVISLMENLQREDLNPMEEASGIRMLMDSCQLTQEQAAQKLGKSRSAVANALRLLGLHRNAQDDLHAGRISAGHARGILSLDNEEAQEKLRQQIVAQGMSVREVEEAVAAYKANGLFPWEAGEDTGTGASQKSGATSRTASKKDPQLHAAAKRIAATLNCKARITGDVNKGKITLHYEDTATLEDLLASLGAGRLEDEGN